MRINGTIRYRGEDQIIVYIIPEFTAKGVRQIYERSAYIAPLNKIVSIRELLGMPPKHEHKI